jgi:hypothetical protein
MKLRLIITMLLASSVWACECGEPGPACSWAAETDVIFLGTPVYTDDDGSGTFVQQTLYRFEVEELFKGLPAGTRTVWVDPGSYTSCYAEYDLGRTYLVFASRTWGGHGNSAAMTLSYKRSKKPLPPSFEAGMPVYYAPECTGTRVADGAQSEVMWLRLWRDGKTKSRLYGRVTDDAGVALFGARITARGRNGAYTASSGADGTWSLEGIAGGRYAIDAELAKYEQHRWLEAEVAAGACAYLDLFLQTNGAVSGIVLDSKNKRLQGIQLEVTRLKSQDEPNLPCVRTKSLRDGTFRVEGLPGGDYIVGVNLYSDPNPSLPYRRTYAPGVSQEAEARVIHIEPMGVVSGVELRMPPALPSRNVNVLVNWQNGRRAGKGVFIFADVAGGSSAESAITDRNGVAHLKCLVGLDYEISAREELAKAGRAGQFRLFESRAKRLTSGKGPASVKLTLQKADSSTGRTPFYPAGTK